MERVFIAIAQEHPWAVLLAAWAALVLPPVISHWVTHIKTNGKDQAVLTVLDGMARTLQTHEQLANARHQEILRDLGRSERRSN